MRQKAKLMAILGISILFTFTTIACSSSDKKQTAESDEIRVTLFPASVFLDLWVIKDQQLDKQRGFNLKLIETTGGSAQFTPILGGHADAAEGTPGISMLYHDQGKLGNEDDSALVNLPAFPVIATPDNPATAIVADKTITELSEIKGKNFAAHSDVSDFYFSARATLAQHNVPIGNDKTDTKLSVMPMADMGTAIKQGRISAGVMDYYTAMATEAQGNGHILEIVEGAGEWEDWPYISWVFNGDFYRNNEPLVKKFMWTILDAHEWIKHNKKAAKNLLIDKLGTPESIVDEFIDDYPLDGYVNNLDLGEPVSSNVVWNKMGKLLHDLNVLDELPSADDIYLPRKTVEDIQEDWDGKE